MNNIEQRSFFHEAIISLVPDLLHLHTYFLFPFAIDKDEVRSRHKELWTGSTRWLEGLDAWIAQHCKPDTSPLLDCLGPWQRSAYTRFDWDAAAYHDMVFFHPVVRAVFFDTANGRGASDQESLLRCYQIDPNSTCKLRFAARDVKGRSAEVDVTDLRLFLFANGIGVLSIGVEAFGISGADALWINESMRKIYPSSGRQLREGRIPHQLSFVAAREGGAREVLAEENFEQGELRGVLPPLSKTIKELLYFADYEKDEYEPVLDERMIVYTYAALDPASLPDNYITSEDYKFFLSRLLYVDRDGPSYRYDPQFVREQMGLQMYDRWAHLGTWYGFTSYSNITVVIGTYNCDEHELREGFLIHRMFAMRYFLAALVAIFYRATLLSFEERSAQVSKKLYLDQEKGKIHRETISSANDLRASFVQFTNYWYFSELANKDEEMEHFKLQCEQFRIEPKKQEIEDEIGKLNSFLDNYYQSRNTEAVNRLALLSLIFGAGAVLTGFFGMNFGRGFQRLFFEPDSQSLPFHYAAVAIASVLALGALLFGLYVVVIHWADYKETLVPRRRKRFRHRYTDRRDV